MTVDVRLRALALGLACGLRSAAGPAAVAATRVPGDERRGQPLALLASPRAAQLAPLAAAGELVADKLPWTPSRLAPPALAGRLLSGAGSGAALAQRVGPAVPASAVLGAAGALAASVAGARWRGVAASWGLPDLAAALLEDVAAYALALLATGPAGAR